MATYTNDGDTGTMTGTHAALLRDWTRDLLAKAHMEGTAIGLATGRGLPEGAVLVWAEPLGALTMVTRLEKGLTHRYIKRVPIVGKDGRRRYRYWYAIPGQEHLAHDEHLVEGAAFKVEGGHYHVTKVDGDNVHVRHDETGEEKVLTRGALAKLLHEHHKGAIEKRHARLSRDHAAAQKTGTEAQKARARAALEHHERLYGRPEGAEKKPEKVPPAKGAAKSATPQGKAPGGVAAAQSPHPTKEELRRRVSASLAAQGMASSPSAAPAIRPAEEYTNADEARAAANVHLDHARKLVFPPMGATREEVNAIDDERRKHNEHALVLVDRSVALRNQPPAAQSPAPPAPSQSPAAAKLRAATGAAKPAAWKSPVPVHELPGYRPDQYWDGKTREPPPKTQDVPLPEGWTPDTMESFHRLLGDRHRQAGTRPIDIPPADRKKVAAMAKEDLDNHELWGPGSGMSGWDSADPHAQELRQIHGTFGKTPYHIDWAAGRDFIHAETYPETTGARDDEGRMPPPQPTEREKEEEAGRQAIRRGGGAGASGGAEAEKPAAPDTPAAKLRAATRAATQTAAATAVEVPDNRVAANREHIADAMLAEHAAINAAADFHRDKTSRHAGINTATHELHAHVRAMLSRHDAGETLSPSDVEAVKAKANAVHSAVRAAAQEGQQGKETPTRPFGGQAAGEAAVAAVAQQAPPEKHFADLAGGDDGARTKDLARRVPALYGRLKGTFAKAGVAPVQAKTMLAHALSRQGWQPEARAALVGGVETHGRAVAENHRQITAGAENLAGGDRVAPAHVATAVDLRAPQGEDFHAHVARVAEQAEKEIADLHALIAKAQSDPAAGNDALHKAMTSPALQRLIDMARAYPGLRDRAIDPARAVVAEAQSAEPRQAPTRDGAAATVFLAGEGGAPRALKARYRLVEAADLVPSHSPTSFSPHPKYPAGLQERAYHRDKAEQAKVIRNAQGLRPELVVNTNPDAVNGPPLVTADGVVLGGNSRTMSMVRAYNDDGESAKRLRSYLRDNAHQVGLRPEDVDAMKSPVLVREVDPEDKSPANMKLLVRQMNESFTQAMDPRTMQVAMGRKLTDEALRSLAGSMQEEETLNAFLGTRRAEPFIGHLRKAGIIDQRNENQYTRKGRPSELNEDGKGLVERVLVGRVVGDADTMSDARPSMVQSLARAVPYIVQAESAGEGYSLREALKTALSAHNELSRLSEKGAIRMPDAKAPDHEFREAMAHLGGNLFGDDHPVLKDPKSRTMLEVMIRRGGPNQLSGVFREYASMAAKNPENQARMAGMGPTYTPEQVFDLAIKGALRKEGAEPRQAGLALAFDATRFVPLSPAARLRAALARQ